MLDFAFTCLDGNTSGATATINVTRSNMKVAPEGMIFTVDIAGFDTPAPANPNDYDPRFHNIYYFWDFGDLGSQFTAPVQALPHQLDANKMNGPIAGHTYESGGEYTVTCIVHEPSSGKTATAILNLTGANAVQDQDTVFAGDNTYWMDTAGNGTGSPAGSLVYSDIMLALNHAWGNNKPARLLFRDGQTWQLTEDIDVRGSRAYVNILMQGEGGATPAKIKPALGSVMFQGRLFTAGNTMDIVFSGLDFEGPWDETTDLNPSDPQTGLSFNNAGTSHAPNYVWMHKCRSYGFYSTLTMTTADNDSGALGISDCDIGSWLNIGLYLNTRCPTAVFGNKIARDPEALGGGNKTDHGVHGPIRSQYSGPLCVTKNDMFSNSGWFPNEFGFFTQQPTNRIFQSGLPGGRACFSQNTFEGGYQVLASSRQNPGLPLNVQNLLVDGCVFIGGYMTRFAIQAEYGGITLRNSLYVRPDTETINAIYDPQCMLSASLPTGADEDGTTPQQLVDNADAPIQVYNNSYVMLSSDANFFGSVQAADVVLTSGFNAVSEANNLIHAPNANTPITSDAPLSTVDIFTPRMLGDRTAYEYITHTLVSNVSDGTSFTMPYPAGRAAGDYGPLTAVDYHSIRVGGDTYRTEFNDVTFAFGVSEITVTNTSGSVWLAGDIEMVLYCLNNPPPRQNEYATPVTGVATYAPLGGSLADGAATGTLISYTDFYGNVVASGRSRGAFEVA